MEDGPSPERKAGGRPAARGDRVRALVAPAGLALLALLHLGLVLGAGLSPWNGGGFGMFSTLDHEGWRTLRLAVERPGAAEPERVPVPPELLREVRRAKVHPTRPLLRRLALRIAAAQPEARAVHVEVLRTRFDPATLEARREPLAALRHATEAR